MVKYFPYDEKQSVEVNKNRCLYLITLWNLLHCKLEL